MKKIEPKLTVIGAGPGDAELITIKAARLLSKADIVLYDALVNEELLGYVPNGVPKIFVGKRAHVHEYTQQQINDLIVDSAFSFGHVVRLKGGDPFVFGRGSEEIEHARSFNIATAYVPGISSSIGVAGLQHIPVTHRGLSESFWVITGTTSSGKISNDVKQAAETNATVVILMGVSKLNEIVEIFKKAGKPDLPVAIIQNGSLPDEKYVIGKINDIEKRVVVNQIEAPAIIVIGEVVSLHPEFSRSVVAKINVNQSFYSLN
ncbi:MAG: uroporphyrinogen-III C-methyltransferase [Flavobacteriales bacterium]